MIKSTTIITLLNAHLLKLWVEKHCDPLKGLHHPRHSTLYVVLQKKIHDSRRHCIVFMMQYMNKNGEILR